MVFRVENSLFTIHKPDNIKQENSNISVFDKINTLDDKVKAGAKLVPPLRKGLSAFENGDAGNLAYAAGMGFRTLNELKEDFHDVKHALTPGLKQVQHWDKQHPFWCVQDCMIEKTKVGQFLKNYDKTLFDFNSVQKFLAKTGMTNAIAENNFYKIEGSVASKILGGATLRVPVLGAGLFAAMEVPSVVKAENKSKAILKSALKIGLVMGFAAIFGCAGRFYGKIVELAAMGIGLMLGGKAAEKINKVIDEIKI